MRILLTLIAVVVIAAVAALAVIYTGAYNVAATDPHFPPVRWALDTTFKNSVRLRAEDIETPPLDDPQMVEQGARRYASTCATCHGVPDQPLPNMAQHMRPQPPPLAEAATEWAPNEIFWILEHGVKMTGMPAWGPWHSDDQLWSIVAFVEGLPEMSSEEYERLIAPSAQQEREQEQEQEAAPGEEAEGEGARPDAAEQAAAPEAAPAEPDADGAEPAATVEMTDTLKFKPATVTIKAGETVEWTNPSRLRHTVTADPDKANDPKNVDLPDGAEPFDSGYIEPGGRYTHQFTVPGHYKYFCMPHEAAGMIGEVIVEEGAASASAEGQGG